MIQLIRLIQFLCLFSGGFFALEIYASVQIESLQFRNEGTHSEIWLKANKALSIKKKASPNRDLWEFEFPGAKIQKDLLQKIDTSGFITPLKSLESQSNQSQVSIKVSLKEARLPQIRQNGKVVRIRFPKSSAREPDVDVLSYARAAEASDPLPLPEKPKDLGGVDLGGEIPGQKANLGELSPLAQDPITFKGQDNLPVLPPVNTSQPSSQVLLPSVSLASSANVPNKVLDDFIQSQKVQKFVGKPLTLQVRDVPVTDVLRMLGDYSGFNMVISNNVKGSISLSLTDVPWDQALDLVLKTQRLGAERNANVLRILPLKDLKDEKDEEEKLRLAALEVVPLVTRVFPISYATLSDISKTLNMLVSYKTQASTNTSSPSGTDSSPQSSTNSNPIGGRTFVQADSRTNSLIVRDTEENIDRMKKLLEILDTQTPQIMIEAKIVEVTEAFSKNMSGNLGFGSPTGSSGWLASMSGANPLDPLLGSPGVFSTGADVGTSTSSGSGLGGLSLDFLPGISRLNAVLQIGETENMVKIVSAPKTVVINRQAANIVQGTPVLVPTTTTVAGVGNQLSSTVASANISLTVTPSVTNDGSVMMTLSVSKDVPINLPAGLQGVGQRSMNTSVLVDSGSTLVIGGIFTVQSSFKAQGVPFLRNLPVIGVLFGGESKSDDRSELYIFVTPKILNSKDAGLIS